MKIISEIKVDGKWVDQDLLPKETVAKIVAEVICSAGKHAVFETKEKKTA